MIKLLSGTYSGKLATLQILVALRSSGTHLDQKVGLQALIFVPEPDSCSLLASLLPAMHLPQLGGIADDQRTALLSSGMNLAHKRVVDAITPRA